MEPLTAMFLLACRYRLHQGLAWQSLLCAAKELGCQKHHYQCTHLLISPWCYKDPDLTMPPLHHPTPLLSLHGTPSYNNPPPSSNYEFIPTSKQLLSTRVGRPDQRWARFFIRVREAVRNRRTLRLNNLHTLAGTSLFKNLKLFFFFLPRTYHI